MGRARLTKRPRCPPRRARPVDAELCFAPRAQGCWVVSSEWAQACASQRRAVDPLAYEFQADSGGGRGGPEAGRRARRQREEAAESGGGGGVAAGAQLLAGCEVLLAGAVAALCFSFAASAAHALPHRSNGATWLVSFLQVHLATRPESQRWRARPAPRCSPARRPPLPRTRRAPRRHPLLCRRRAGPPWRRSCLARRWRRPRRVLVMRRRLRARPAGWCWWTWRAATASACSRRRRRRPVWPRACSCCPTSGCSTAWAPSSARPPRRT